MKIKDRPEFKSKLPVFALKGDESSSKAIRTMTERNIGSVVIVDEQTKVRGIVTERDLLRRLLGKGLDPKTTPLSEIMTSEVKTASSEDHVIDWLRRMSNERFRHLPVVNGEGKLVSILSQGDFVAYTWPELWRYFQEKASETFRGPTAPVPILFGGLMVYTLAIIIVMKYL